MSHASAVAVVRDFLEGPMTRSALLRWRQQKFLSEDGFGSYFGLFDGFAAARDWLPRNPGFNLDALATEYVDVRTRQVFAYDYPVMWWLDRAFDGGARSILDIGGSVGVHYYAYRSYIDMPAALTWRIVEVPAMAAIGRKLAAEQRVGALSFTEKLREGIASPADIWIAAGSIHYLEDARPADLLKQCAVKPAHILLNKLPLCDSEDFVTAQNIGEGCFVPLHVFNRQRFIGDIKASGYVLRDRWLVYERSLYLPGHPERSFPAFSGLYFVSESANR